MVWAWSQPHKRKQGVRTTMAVLQQLRAVMSSMRFASKPLTGYIIPTDDCHQSEYIADCDKRREFISGFTGSAGICLVTNKSALLWTDGRYHIQASKELGEEWTLMKAGCDGVPTLAKWMKTELPAESVVGFDPSLISEALYKQWSEVLDGSTISLLPVARNLVDEVWGAERPGCPDNSIFFHPLEYSGQTWKEKVATIRKELEKEGASALVATALDEVAWLYNLRGSDVEYNPVFFSYAIVTPTDASLFVDKERLTPEALQQLTGDGDSVSIYPYSDICDKITALLSNEGKIWISAQSSYGVCSLVPAQRRIRAMCPIQRLKAIKNSSELQGMRRAHLTEAIALCEYYDWLEKEVSSGEVTEISASDKLETLRKELPGYVGPSFCTISASGPNGAVTHYRPAPSTNRTLTVDEIYLCDTGSQFRYGTTDITRTIHFGTPSDEQKDRFTRVLKGHIALATVIFPSKSPGSRIDSFARSALWQVGLDYRHGTGHGVGAFLNVHEGPHGLSGSRSCPAPIEEHMLISDEPGFYEDGQYGIRIESVMEFVKADTPHSFGGGQFLTMDPLTLVPIQVKMINPALLTAEEVQWLNDYHTRCRSEVGPLLLEEGKTAAYQWLLRETQLMG